MEHTTSTIQDARIMFRRDVINPAGMTREAREAAHQKYVGIITPITKDYVALTYRLGWWDPQQEISSVAWLDAEHAAFELCFGRTPASQVPPRL